jgi:hypothetical protein
MPPIHPVYGPGVFDYQNNCWTFPYAKWYNPQLQSEIHIEPSSEEEEEEVMEEVEEPKPELAESGMQTDPI